MKEEEEEEEEERGMKLLLVTTLIYLPTETSDKIISLIITLKNNDVSFYQWNHQHIYIFNYFYYVGNFIVNY